MLFNNNFYILYIIKKKLDFKEILWWEFDKTYLMYF